MKIFLIGDFHGKFPEKLKKIIKKENPDFILSTGDYAGIDEWRPLLKKLFKSRGKGKKLSISDLIGEKQYERLVKLDYSAGEKIIKEMNKLRIPVFSVFGNGDWYESDFNDSGLGYEPVMRKLKFIKNIQRGFASFRGLNIAGFGGYIDNDVYFTRKGRKAIGDSKSSNAKRRKRYNREKRDFDKIMKISPDILLLHYTPYNCLDKLRTRGLQLTGEKMGISFFNSGIKKYKPMLTICGHMHENQGVCKIGGNLVINPGAACDGKAAIVEIENKKISSIEFVK